MFFFRFLILIIIYFPTILSGDEFSSKIKILILSKVLQTSENRKTIEFKSFEKFQIKNNIDGSVSFTNYLKLSKDTHWTLISDFQEEIFDKTILGKNIQIYEDGIYLGIYPLPIKLISKEDFRGIIVYEEPYKYSIDSAMAELGDNDQDSKEALFSTALIILARSKKKLQLNNNYHFTDLSNTQKYKGIILSDKINFQNECKYEIDINKLKGELFFHSESGGITLSQKIFGNKNEGFGGVKDILLNSKEKLYDSKIWERKISINEIQIILGRIFTKKELIDLFTNYRTENLRLKINRIKGWSFLKSNDYTIKIENNLILFSGKGHGHNVGLSLIGAKKLSSLGFSRYEILYHYFPGIKFFKNIESYDSPDIYYLLFDNSGNTIYSSYPTLAKRKIPPGSFMKILTSLSILNINSNLKFKVINCQPSPDKQKCWNKNGHGKLDMEKAIPHSCNYYFSSFKEIIPKSKFNSEIINISEEIKIPDFLSVTEPGRNYDKILPGLDFKILWKVQSIKKLIYFLKESSSNHGIENNREFIFKSLHDTFQIGTASDLDGNNAPPDLWGKTSTVGFGTNEMISYGFFLGGNTKYSILLIFRGEIGRNAALKAKEILNSKD